MESLMILENWLRRRLVPGAFTSYGGARDYYVTLGYTREITLQQYWERYERGGIASRIIELPCKDTWKRGVRLTGNEALSAAWERRQSEFVAALRKVDILSGIGHYGVLLLGIQDGRKLSDPVGTGRLSYLRAFWEGDASIAENERNAASARYEMPTAYRIKFVGGDVTVHWTRCIHVAEGRVGDPVFGTPRLKRVFNYLDDLLKLVGGSAEASWLNMRPGILITNQPEYSLPDDEENRRRIEDAVREYLHDMARVLTLEGVQASVITGQVVDPSGPAGVVMQLIAAATGIPQRVLFGDPAGALAAAAQDMKQWHAVIVDRQRGYAEPEILRPFVKRLQALGVLPPGDFGVEWPPLDEPTREERAATMEATARAAKLLANPVTGELPITYAEARRLLGFEDVGPSPSLVSNEGHRGVRVEHVCPLCGGREAIRYEGHKGLLVCAECGRTYDPEVEP